MVNSLKASDFVDVQKETSIVMMALLSRCENTILPELYAVIGHEKFLDFLEIFAGLKITVPSPGTLLKAIEDCRIYLELSKIQESKSKSKNEDHRIMISRLAAQYRVTNTEIKKRYSRLKTIIANYETHT